MRAVHSKLGAEIDAAYAEAFRYECVEMPVFLQS
jgi:hypothetical protein